MSNLLFWSPGKPLQAYLSEVRILFELLRFLLIFPSTLSDKMHLTTL